MKISKEKIKDVGSCNFCNKETLRDIGYGLDYPYSHVYEFESEQSGGIRVRMCDECFDEFVEKVNQIKNDYPKQ